MAGRIATGRWLTRASKRDLAADLLDCRAALSAARAEREENYRAAEENATRADVAEKEVERLAVKFYAAEAKLAEARKVVEPFRFFVEKWDAHPIRGLHDDLYMIHGGDDQASIRLSDLRRAAAWLDGAK